MRKVSAFFLLCLFVMPASRVGAQSYYTRNEIGIALGGSQYFGDLNDSYGLKTVTPAGGIYVRRRMNGYISLKIVANYTRVGYDDKYNSDPFEKERNLNFKSDVIEGALQAEFNFFKFITGDTYNRWTPFLTGGVGAFYYNPYTTLDGTRYYLRPLGTEGQGTPRYNDRTKYALTQVSIPFGFGLKHNISEHWNLGFEFGWRKTFTGYLDDVSNTYVPNDYLSHFSGALAARMAIGNNPANLVYGDNVDRGNPNTDDWYMFGGVTITYTILPPYCPHF